MTKPWLGMWESGHLPGTGKLQREKPLGKPWVWVKDGVTILLNPANPIQTKHFRSQDLATEILTLHLHISVCKREAHNTTSPNSPWVCWASNCQTTLHRHCCIATKHEILQSSGFYCMLCNFQMPWPILETKICNFDYWLVSTRANNDYLFLHKINNAKHV